MKKEYEIIKSEEKFNGKIIKIIHDNIVLPDKKIATMEIAKRGDACAIVAVDKDRNIILIRQYRHSLKEKVIEIPAGMVNDGEDIENCAIRELKEETGYTAKNIRHIITICPSIGFCTEKIYIYLATELEKGEIAPDDDEFIETFKLSLNEIEEKIYNGDIIDAKTISGILACKKYINI